MNEQATNHEPMTWQTFKHTLGQHFDKRLQFQYAEGAFVHPSFHLTEIKQASIVSVDCGGQMNAWTEVIVQLWEPQPAEAHHAMPVSKALSIIDLVEKSLPLDPAATVKIEFGNTTFDTRQLYPGELTTEGNRLTVNLTPDYTQCKALSRGGRCDTPSVGEPCCAPADANKTAQPTLVFIETEAPACTPGSGCC